MSKSKYEVEVERAEADSHSNPINKLNGAVRVIGANNLADGDVVTIPKDFKSFEQDIAGSESKAQYIIVSVKRADKELAIRFYPSSFAKMGTSVKEIDGSYERDGFVHANGSVVDFVQGFADLDEATHAVAEHGPFKVGLTPVKLVTYEAREKDVLVKDDIRDTHMPTYDWE